MSFLMNLSNIVIVLFYVDKFLHWLIVSIIKMHYLRIIEIYKPARPYFIPFVLQKLFTIPIVKISGIKT